MHPTNLRGTRVSFALDVRSRDDTNFRWCDDEQSPPVYGVTLPSGTPIAVARTLAAFSAVWLLWPISPQSSAIVRAAASPEYLTKATFLCNFALFVEWPADVFTTRDAPIVLGVVGNDPFEQALDDTIRNKRIKGRPIVVRRLQAAQDLRQAHILFVSTSEAGRHEELIARVGRHPVLLVGDTPDFARQGGAIAFTMEAERVRFEINLDATRRAGLNVSAKLLKLARVVAANPRANDR